jgi:hypothetical protein
MGFICFISRSWLVIRDGDTWRRQIVFSPQEAEKSSSVIYHALSILIHHHHDVEVHFSSETQSSKSFFKDSCSAATFCP